MNVGIFFIFDFTLDILTGGLKCESAKSVFLF